MDSSRTQRPSSELKDIRTTSGPEFYRNFDNSSRSNGLGNIVCQTKMVDLQNVLIVLYNSVQYS